MLRNDEPPRQLSPPEPVSEEDKQKSSRKLLQFLLTVNDGYVKEHARSRLAKMDAKPAEKQGAAKKPASLNSNDITKVAEHDVEEALSLLPSNANQAYYKLKDLAKHFADSDPEKALRFTAEAIIRGAAWTILIGLSAWRKWEVSPAGWETWRWVSGWYAKPPTRPPNGHRPTTGSGKRPR